MINPLAKVFQKAVLVLKTGSLRLAFCKNFRDVKHVAVRFLVDLAAACRIGGESFS